MTRKQAFNQSLAASGGALTAFIGVVHETVGLRIFPWGEAFLGGPIGWQSAGILCVLIGVLLFAAALQLVRLPTRAVVAIGAVQAVGGVAVTVITAVLRQDFHVFALTLAIAGGVIAYCYPRSLGD